MIEKNVLLSSSLHNVKNSVISIRAINTSEATVKLYKDTIIGELEKLDSIIDTYHIHKIKEEQIADNSETDVCKMINSLNHLQDVQKLKAKELLIDSKKYFSSQETKIVIF